MRPGAGALRRPSAVQAFGDDALRNAGALRPSAYGRPFPSTTTPCRPIPRLFLIGSETARSGVQPMDGLEEMTEKIHAPRFGAGVQGRDAWDPSKRRWSTMSQKVRIDGVRHTGASVFLGVDH